MHLVAILLALFAHGGETAQKIEQKIEQKIIKFDPLIAPEYVELKKKQAEDRKQLYATQAKERFDAKQAHKAERDQLIETHRAARRKFLDEKHTQEERTAFFSSQRTEMHALEARQKAADLERDSKRQRELSEFHTEQRKALEELAEKLRTARN